MMEEEKEGWKERKKMICFLSIPDHPYFYLFCYLIWIVLLYDFIVFS